MTNPSPDLLCVKNLDVFYGMICALKNVSFQVKQGESLAIVGANGAGKSSLLNTLAGLVRQRKGAITYNGKDISSCPSYKRSRSGLILVPEGRRLFTRLTVEENLKCGHFFHPQKEFLEIKEQIYAIFPRLAERHTQLAGYLSGGEQQMLAIGRALASKPKLLMLDEPSMGLAPTIVKTIFEAINTIRQQKVTVILVEQNIRLAIKHTTRTIILENGTIKTEGLSQDISNSDLLLNYL